MTNKYYEGIGDVNEFYSFPPLHKQATKPIDTPSTPPHATVTPERKQSIQVRMLKQQAGLE